MPSHSIKLWFCLTVSLLLSSCGVSSSAVVPITRVPGVPTDPGAIVWLGDWLVFERYGDGDERNYAYSPRLWRIRPDGTGLAQLPLPDYSGCQQNAFFAPTRLPDGRLGYLVRCMLSPTNTAIYMLAYQWPNGPTVALRTSSIDPIGIGDYSWNPDMMRGITSGGNVLVSDLTWFTRDHTQKLMLSFPQALNPQWSPDGTTIAFLAAPDQDLSGIARLDAVFNLYLMAPNGTQIRPLGEGFRNATTIAWSPDSRWLVLRATFGTLFPEQGVWLIDVATGQRRLVAQGDFTSVKWAPTGEQFVAFQNIGTAGEPSKQMVLLDLRQLLSLPRKERGMR